MKLLSLSDLWSEVEFFLLASLLLLKVGAGRNQDWSEFEYVLCCFVLFCLLGFLIFLKKIDVICVQLLELMFS